LIGATALHLKYEVATLNPRDFSRIPGLSFGITDANKFLAILQKACHGQEVRIVALMRTVGVESWLRGLRHRALIWDCAMTNGRDPAPVEAGRVLADPM